MRKRKSKICIFPSGDGQQEELSDAWVAQQKRNITVTFNTLFLHRNASQARKNVKEQLLETCYPLTSCQRTGDWFVMKAGRLTGTMAGKVVAIEDFDSDDEDAVQELFSNC